MLHQVLSSADNHKIVLFRLTAKVFEEGLLVKSLHHVPIFHKSMPNRGHGRMCCLVQDGFFANVKVKVIQN